MEFSGPGELGTTAGVVESGISVQNNLGIWKTSAGTKQGVTEHKSNMLSVGWTAWESRMQFCGRGPGIFGSQTKKYTVSCSWEEVKALRKELKII